MQPVPRVLQSRSLVIASVVWVASTIIVLTAVLGYFALRHYDPIPDCDELFTKALQARGAEAADRWADYEVFC